MAASQESRRASDIVDELKGSGRQDYRIEPLTEIELFEAGFEDGRVDGVIGAVATRIVQHRRGIVEAGHAETRFRERYQNPPVADRGLEHIECLSRLEALGIELDVPERAPDRLVDIVDQGGQTAICRSTVFYHSDFSRALPDHVEP